MQNYIEITQDGIGRIARADHPDDVIGLYTCQIQTCTVILIASAKGISLIHNTGKIRAIDVAAEFSWHEKVIFWTIVYNSEFYPKDERNEDLEKKIGYYKNHLIEVIGREAFNKIKPQNDYILTDALNGFVAFTIKASIQLAEKPPQIKEFEEKKLRHQINLFNNIYLNSNEFIPADIQYDGKDFTPMPLFFKKPNEIEEMADSARFQAYSQAVLGLEFYRDYTAFLMAPRDLPNIDIAALLDEVNAEEKEEENYQRVSIGRK